MSIFSPFEDIDLVVVSGFGDKGVAELAHGVASDMGMSVPSVIPGSNWYLALQSPKNTLDRVTKMIDFEHREREMILIGHSYGALLALVIACRQKLQRIYRLILIDGPLRHDVEVLPLRKGHHLFFRHYRDRKRLAQIFPESRENLDLSKIVTLGSEEDSIVPPAAKRLDGVRFIPLSHRGHGLRVETVRKIIYDLLSESIDRSFEKTGVE